MKRQMWIPLAIGIVAAYVILDRRAAKCAAEDDDLESVANNTADWGSKQRVVGTGRRLLGRVKEGLGRLTADDDLIGQGVVDQIAGAVQNTSGIAAHAVSDTMHDLHRP